MIELPTGLLIPILYEDRSTLAIDKPAGWLLVPDDWEKTSRNLQLALNSSINAGDFWARSRNLKFLRYVHRLDAETSGVLLLGKSPGALSELSHLFETRRVEKKYWAVVHGIPKETNWSCRAKLGPDSREVGRMKIDEEQGKEAETQFRVLQTSAQTALIEAQPTTGRTHQIRLHLLASGYPIVGDQIYGVERKALGHAALGLRAVELLYPDPFQRRLIRIKAPTVEFARQFGFADSPAPPERFEKKTQ